MGPHQTIPFCHTSSFIYYSNKKNCLEIKDRRKIGRSRRWNIAGKLLEHEFSLSRSKADLPFYSEWTLPPSFLFLTPTLLCHILCLCGSMKTWFNIVIRHCWVIACYLLSKLSGKTDKLELNVSDKPELNVSDKLCAALARKTSQCQHNVKERTGAGRESVADLVFLIWYDRLNKLYYLHSIVHDCFFYTSCCYVSVFVFAWTRPIAGIFSFYADLPTFSFYN